MDAWDLKNNKQSFHFSTHPVNDITNKEYLERSRLW